jgi:hypothetical protein
MTFSQRVEAGKPYLTGFILGLVAAPIVAFSAGWVSTTGARAEAVENGRIEVLADVCSDAATRLSTTQSMDLTTLKGWDNRAKRDAFVAETMATIQVPEDLATRVSAQCGRTFA